MKAIENILIPVTDQLVSKEFYLRLGFKVIIEADLGEGNHWIQLALGNQQTTISLVKDWPYSELKAGSLQGLILETDNILKEKVELNKKGILMSEIKESPYGQMAFISDPDKNGLSIHQFK